MPGDDEAGVGRRLAPRFRVDCWIGLCVRILSAASRETPDGIVHTPDHFLAAAWSPPSRGPARWPEVVVIGSPTSARTLAELLRHVPDEAMLHLAGLDDVDAALAADILAAADRNLEPYQRDAVVAFAHSERARARELVAARYSDRDAGFERFRAVVLGDLR